MPHGLSSMKHGDKGTLIGRSQGFLSLCGTAILILMACFASLTSSKEASDVQTQYQYDASGNRTHRRGYAGAGIEGRAHALMPTAGMRGDRVNILGTGFFPERMNEYAVSFGGIPGTITKMSWTTILVVVPDGAETGNVTITTPSGENLLAGAFTVLSGYDADEDGLPDFVEQFLGLSPELADSDGDGVLDVDEDSDGDGVSNRIEMLRGFDVTLADSDFDGIPDGEEDADGDGILDTEEMLDGEDGFVTDPDHHDTDRDGFVDGDETEHGSDPTNPDSMPIDPYQWVPYVESPLLSIRNDTNPVGHIAYAENSLFSIQNNRNPMEEIAYAESLVFSARNNRSPKEEIRYAESLLYSLQNNISPIEEIPYAESAWFSIKNTDGTVQDSPGQTNEKQGSKRQ